MISEEKQYALMFDGTDHDDILIGTAAEVGRRYLEIESIELKVDFERDEDGEPVAPLGYFVRFDPTDEEDWDLMGYLDDQSSMTDNLNAAYAAYFLKFILPEEYNGYLAFELDTPGKKAFAEWDADELLDHITLKDVRDAKEGLNYEDEFGLRCWYYENKLQSAEMKSKAA